MQKPAVFILGLVVFFSCSLSARADRFGKDTQGSTNRNNMQNMLIACQYVNSSSVDGTINQIFVYIGALSFLGGDKATVAIYDDNGGAPDNRIAQSSQLTLTANSWNSFDIGATTVTPNATYWLAIILTQATVITEDPAASADTFIFNAPPYTTFPASLNGVTPNLTRTWDVAIYADAMAATATFTDTPVPGSPTDTPTQTPTSSSTPTPSPTPRGTHTVSPTPTPSPTISPTDTPQPSATISPSRTSTPTITLTPTPRKPSLDLSAVRVFPNPWRADAPGHSRQVVFDRLAGNTAIVIYALDGRVVRELPIGCFEDSGQTNNPGNNGRAEWALTNRQGNVVASGIYIYIAKDPEGHTTTGKIAIMK